MRFLTRLLTTMVLISAATTCACYYAFTRYIDSPLNSTQTDAIVFDTENSSNVRHLASQLEKQGLVRSGVAFRILARVQKKDTQIKAGEYALAASMTPQQILDKLVRGETIPRRATIREGMTLIDIAQTLHDAGIVERGLFEKALSDESLLQEEGIEANSFEGYLFPETYHFRRNTQAHHVIKVMHEQLRKQWSPEWSARAAELGMSRHQILTLASIIEKESGNFDEQPIIASVFHNRLKIKMRLQADPTVIYGMKDFNGNITKRDLQTETPYNTYVIQGLPPGPIANPGLSAIRAALYPAESKYLYFVGNGEGRHIFSENLERHNSAVNRFQRGGARRERSDTHLTQAKGPGQEE